MTTRDVRNKCRTELNVKSDGAYDLFVNEELDEFVSFGIRQFYERRLSGLTSDRTSFEQWQKRSDDLRPVYTKYEVDSSETGTKNKARWSSYKVPDNYWHMLSEDVDVIRTTGTGDDEVVSEVGTFDVFECTTDNFTARLNDSLGSHIFDKESLRPLRLYVFKHRQIDDVMIDGNYLSIINVINDDESTLLSIGDTVIDNPTDSYTPIDMYSTLYYKAPAEISLGKYRIEYIRKPNGFGLYSDENLNDVFNEDDRINQVPDYAWDEVIAIVVKHALENSSSYRVQTYNAERMEIQ